MSSSMQLVLPWEDLSPLLQWVGHLSKASVTSLDSENKDILVAILKCEALIVLFHTSSQRQQLHSVA